jgi:hypothetical protein
MDIVEDFASPLPAIVGADLLGILAEDRDRPCCRRRFERRISIAARARSAPKTKALLARQGWRKLMPRPFHPQRDLAAQQDFKKAAFHVL